MRDATFVRLLRRRARLRQRTDSMLVTSLIPHSSEWKWWGRFLNPRKNHN